MIYTRSNLIEVEAKGEKEVGISGSYKGVLSSRYRQELCPKMWAPSRIGEASGATGTNRSAIDL